MRDLKDASFLWIRNRWWGRYQELRADSEIVATLEVSGSCAVAETNEGRWKIQRLRLPAYIALKNAATDELAARLSLMPRRGLLAAFDDGSEFHLGWVNLWRGEWRWTDADDVPVLLSRRPLFQRRHQVRVGTAGCAEPKLAQLAILERASMEVSMPWS